MRSQKSHSYLSTISIALCIEFVTLSLGVSPLRAQSLQLSLEFPPTENVGAPSRSTSGGTRSPQEACIKGSTSLAALAPSNNVLTTASSNPTLYWYVPQTKAKSAEFVVKDKDSDNQEREIYKATVALNGNSGIVKLTIPASVYLATDKNYLWQFALICDRTDNSVNNYVEGWMKRTELSWDQQRKLAAEKEPLQQAEMYAKANIWQEAVTILAQLRSERPNDSKIAIAWKELLASVYIEESISAAPLLECCTVDSVSNSQ